MTDQFVALEWLYNKRHSTGRGNNCTKFILERLGNPQLNFDVLHVVGTNGKGSVCAMLDAGLQASEGESKNQIKIGRFTSPHLTNFRERITVNNQEISDQTVLEFIRWAQSNEIDAGFFDLSLALACAYFANENVSTAVIEAGVGGATDATMALGRVKILVLTNVDLDHLETLGPTLREIATNKAGAIRTGVPVITAARGEALEVIRTHSHQKQAPLYVLDEASNLFQLPQMPRLKGHYQIQNAQLATAALRILGHSEKAVLAALNANWPARFEVFHVLERTIIIDGAHNPAATHALSKNLESGFTLVFGAFERKNVHAMLEPLIQSASHIIFVPPGLDVGDQNALALEFHASVCPNLTEAFAQAIDCTPKGGQIVITGSLYLAGAARLLFTNTIT